MYRQVVIFWEGAKLIRLELQYKTTTHIKIINIS